MTYREYPGYLRDQAKIAKDHVPGSSGGPQDEICGMNGPAGSYVCTRIDGHAGRHEAGCDGGREVVASWHDSDYRGRVPETAL